MALGRQGRQFESGHPDKSKENLAFFVIKQCITFILYLVIQQTNSIQEVLEFQTKSGQKLFNILLNFLSYSYLFFGILI